MADGASNLVKPAADNGRRGKCSRCRVRTDRRLSPRHARPKLNGVKTIDGVPGIPITTSAAWPRRKHIRRHLVPP